MRDTKSRKGEYGLDLTISYEKIMYLLKYAFQEKDSSVLFDNIETELFETREEAEERILTIGKEWYKENETDLPYEQPHPIEIFQSVATMVAYLIDVNYYDYNIPSFLFVIKEINVKNPSNETSETNIINDFTEKLINDYADILHDERGISIKDVKTCAKRYINSVKTYRCEYCNAKIQWEESDDINGDIWGCEKCGKTFCTKCFVDKHGWNVYMNMMQNSDLILCPDCYEGD